MTSNLLLLPGLLCDERLWRDVQSQLQASVLVADFTQDDSIAGMARRALEAAPARFALAGLSMGGYVALEIMRQAPERVTHLAQQARDHLAPFGHDADMLKASVDHVLHRRS